MNTRKSLTMVLATLLTALILPAAGMAATAVSVECAYDNPASTDLVCEVWLDTTETLRSGGVLVDYNNNDLDRLTFTSADRDPAWAFEKPSDPDPGPYPYMLPEHDAAANTVLFIVGKFNADDVDAGITGRAKVGDIVFTRNATPDPGTSGADQATFFGISAALGRPDPFVNFVNTAGTNIDSPVPGFTAIAAERGDVSLDGRITNLDMGLARNLILSGGYRIYADVSGEGDITNLDMALIRNKILGL